MALFRLTGHVDASLGGTMDDRCACLSAADLVIAAGGLNGFHWSLDAEQKPEHECKRIARRAGKLDHLEVVHGVPPGPIAVDGRPKVYWYMDGTTCRIRQQQYP